MIAKRISKDAGVGDNYTRLAEYIAAAEEKGEKLHAFWIQNCDTGTDLADLETALYEIEAVRNMCPDVKEKTYHLIVSFRPGEHETLSKADLQNMAARYINALGFEGYQYVSGTHTNTDNFHMHMAINRVHPQTLKIHNPFRDFKTLEKVSRDLEKEHGLTVDRGMSDRGTDRGGISPEAQDYERHTWQQSFQGYMLEHKDDILKDVHDSKDWSSVHKALAAYDVVIKKRGNGLAFVQATGKRAMKASALDRSCSKARLEERLGPFQPLLNPRIVETPKKHTYQAKPLFNNHPSTKALWRRYTTMRSSPVRSRSPIGRVIGNWKLFLMAEALNDPMALTLIVAHQAFLRLPSSAKPKFKEPVVTRGPNRGFEL